MWTRVKSVFTKERYLKESTKRVIWAVIACVSLAVFFYPSVFAFSDWCAHPNATYHGRKIRLPMFWGQNYLLSWGASWERPPLHAFTALGDEVSIVDAPKLRSDQESLELWQKLYGYAGADDLNRFPELRVLANLGMTCGSIKDRDLNGNKSSMMAVGCLSKDHKTTFEYSGRKSALKAGISIIEQLQ